MRLSGATLRGLGVGVAAFPLLSGGDAVRLAVRRRTPLSTFALSKTGEATPDVTHPIDLALEQPELERAVDFVTRSVLRRALGTAKRAKSALGALDELRGCRAILLPSASGTEAGLLTLWARQRGVRCGVVQHGIYGFRHWGIEDRLVDVLLAWGPAVAAQLDELSGARAAVVPIGVPDLTPLEDRLGGQPRR